MFEYIKDARLKPARSYRKRSKTNLIILHHGSSADGGVEVVRAWHNYHVSRGHAGIDYNIVVDTNGDVWWGRGLEYEGGHVLNGRKTAGMNARSVGICAVGDFQRHAMNDKQKAALKRVARDVANYYGISEIKGHDEVAGPGYTDCPGRYYPLNEVGSYNGGTIAPTPAHPAASAPALARNLKLTKPMMRGDDVKQAQQRLDRHLVDVGGIDGIFGAKTKAGVIDFQKARIKEGRDLGSAGADGVVGVKTWAILWE